MDLLDRLLGHDAWTTRTLLEKCRGLSDAELDREFDIGHRTVRATFTHIIRNMEVWSALMEGREAPSGGGESVGELLARLERASGDLKRVAERVRERGAWDDRWVDVLDDPPRKKTYGGAIAHVVTHSMHHRAQLLYMLRRLGVEELPEGDVLSWEGAVGERRGSGGAGRAPESDRATRGLSLAVGIVSWAGGVLLILVSLPLVVPIGYIGYMTMLSSLFAGRDDDVGSGMNILMGVFLLLFGGGVWYFLFGLVVRIARERDLVRHLGTFLRRSVIACAAWAATAIGFGAWLWGEGGMLGPALVTIGVAAAGHTALVVGLCRRVPRRRGVKVVRAPVPPSEWHAGPQG